MTETSNAEQLELARLAYHAYGETTHWKNYQGNPMPAFDDLGAQIQQAWINATTAIVDYFVGPEPQEQ